MAWTGTPGAGTRSAPLAGSFDWLVIRCHAKDEKAAPQSTQYFQRLFTVAGRGTLNLVDYWHDVSFGQISIAGTIVASGPSADVNGWYTLPITKAQYDALSRTAEVLACANAAFTDYAFSNLYGVITIFPSSDTGASGGETGNYGQTSVPLACSLFGVCFNFNLALVNLPSNANVTYAAHEMGHGFGLHHSRLLSTPTLAYHDGYDIMSAMSVDSLSPSASNPHDVAYGGSILGSVVAAKGPGPDAITLDNEGWIPSHRWSAGPVPLQNTLTLHSLSDPDALTDNPATGADQELLEINLSANVTFPFSPPIQPSCTSNTYTLEYREPVRWDAAIPREASYWNPSNPNQLKEINSADFPVGSVVLHLVCVSSWDPPPPSYRFSFLVDREPVGGGHPVSHNAKLYSSGAPLGAYYPGDEYADNGSGIYFAVNSMSHLAHNAIVTFAQGVGPIADMLTMTAPTAVPFGFFVTASALLTTNNPAPSVNAVVPGHTVTFKLGSKSCDAVTGLDGIASCQLHLVEPPGSKVTLTAKAAATRAYLATSNSSEIDVLAAPGPPPPPVPKIRIKIHRPAPPPKPNAGGA